MEVLVGNSAKKKGLVFQQAMFARGIPRVSQNVGTPFHPTDKSMVLWWHFLMGEFAISCVKHHIVIASSGW